MTPDSTRLDGDHHELVYDLRAAFKTTRLTLVSSRSSIHSSVSPQLFTTAETAIYLGQTEDWVRRELPAKLAKINSGPVRCGPRAPMHWRKRDLDWLIDQPDWESL